MSVRVPLFKKHDQDIMLSLASLGNSNVYNAPAYNANLVIYKGIQSHIDFAVKTQDRKVIALQNKTLYCFLQNREGTKKLVKQLWCEDPSWGRFTLTFEPEEVEDFDAGFYKAVFLTVDDEGNQDVLYTGMENQTELTAIVVANQYDCYIPSTEIDTAGWILHQLNDEKHTKFYESDWIRANKSKNQGFAFYVNGYTCVEIKGSNELEPTHEDKSWFAIDTVELQADNGVINQFYEVACEWVKFEVTDINPIEKILYRN